MIAVHRDRTGRIMANETLDVQVQVVSGVVQGRYVCVSLLVVEVAEQAELTRIVLKTA